MPTRMTWNQLLSTKRQGNPIEKDPTTGRSVYQRDFDRIIYSSAFRRLQDKTQVFPLSKSDFIRTRLTHSLEASCIGRSLGTEVGRRLYESFSKEFPNEFTPPDMGNIVAAACLAHDIGNPPFGHTGEAAIGQWFKTDGSDTIKDLPDSQKKDFEKFEGNAQGFRILTRLQNHTNSGLHLTCATLATLTKYPMASTVVSADIPAQDKWEKHGFFQSEIVFFEEVSNTVGLLQRCPPYPLWTRHPLAFLVEAADDISYLVNDFEDGFRLKYVTSKKVTDHFKEIIRGSVIPEKIKNLSDEDRISYFRGRVINELISQIASCFMKNAEKIMTGEFHDKLTRVVPSADVLNKIRKISKEKIYSSKEALEVEVPGFEVLTGLLKVFIKAVDDVTENKKNPLEKSKRLLKLIPQQFLNNGKPDKDRYKRILQVTDFVSGMTDSYAVFLYKQITGISLPSY